MGKEYGVCAGMSRAGAHRRGRDDLDWTAVEWPRPFRWRIARHRVVVWGHERTWPSGHFSRERKPVSRKAQNRRQLANVTVERRSRWALAPRATPRSRDRALSFLIVGVIVLGIFVGIVVLSPDSRTTREVVSARHLPSDLHTSPLDAPSKRPLPPSPYRHLDRAVSMPASDAPGGRDDRRPDMAVAAAPRAPTEGARPTATVEATTTTTETPGPNVAASPKSHLPLADELIWQAGELDGLPAKPGQSLAPGFTARQSHEEVVTVADAEAFPQEIRPGQAIVVRLPPVPPKHLSLHLVLNTGVPKRGPFPWANKSQGEYLQIRFNDRPVWDRWTACSSNWIHALLPAHLIDERENRVTIENRGTRAWAFDAVWIAEARMGAPTLVALTDAEWMPADLAKQAPVIAVTLPGQLGAGESTQPPFARLKPRDVRSAWRRSIQSRSPEELGFVGHDAAVFRIWREKLGMVIDRGAEPVAIVHGIDDRNPGWLRLAWTFRNFVRHWQVTPSSGEIVATMAELGRTRPDASISAGALAENRWPALDGCSPTLPARISHAVAQEAGHFRAAAMRNGVAASSLSRLALTDRRLCGVRSLPSQYRAAHDVAQAAITWLHAGGTCVALHGLRPGEGVFPNGPLAAAPSWEVIPYLTAVSKFAARGVAANVLPYDAGHGLLDTAWQATWNHRNEINAVLFTDWDAEREVDLTVPVPWTGPAAVTIGGVRLDRKGPPEHLETVRRQAVAEGAEVPGCVTVRLRLTNLMRVRVRPADPSLPRRTIIASGPTPPSAPAIVDGLLRQLPDDGQGLWREPVAAPSPQRVIQVVRGITGTRQAATFGTIDRIDEVVPWDKHSLSVTLSCPDGAAAPRGADLRLDWGRFPAAQRLAFWVRPTASNGSAAVTFVAGTTAARGRMTLRTNQWHRIVAPVDRLAPCLKVHAPSFTLWALPNLPEYRRGGTVKFEFNGFHCLGPSTPGGVPASRAAHLVRIGGNEKSDQYLLLGERGRAAKPWLRFPEAQHITGLKAAVDGLVWEYRPEAQVLQVGIARIPDTAAPVPKEVLRKLPLRLCALANRPEVVAIPIEIRKGL